MADKDIISYGTPSPEAASLLSVSSENLIDDTFLLDVDDPDDIGSPLEDDVPVAAADVLTVGFESPQAVIDSIALIEELQPSLFLGSNIRFDREVAARFSRLADQDRLAHLAHEPYEFRLAPITGINQANLPDAGLVLPLPPEKFDVTKSNDPRTYVAISQREYSLPGPQLLADIAMEGMFPYTKPGQWNQFGKPNYLPRYITRDNYQTPKQMIGHLDALLQSGQPVLLTIAPANGDVKGKKVYGGLVGTNWVTVTGFTYGEAFGHVADYVFSLTLKQWRPIYTSIKKPPHRVVNDTSRDPLHPHHWQPVPPIINAHPGQHPHPSFYTTKAGDSLPDIAARFLGTVTRWPEIYALNAKVIRSVAAKHHVRDYPRGWHIFPGTKLQIPPRGLRNAT